MVSCLGEHRQADMCCAWSRQSCVEAKISVWGALSSLGIPGVHEAALSLQLPMFVVSQVSGQRCQAHTCASPIPCSPTLSQSFCRQERLREAFPHLVSIPRHLKKSFVLLCSSSARTGDTHVPLQMLGETGMNTRKEEKVVVPSKLFNILSNTCSVSWTVSSPSSFVLRC